MRLAAGGQRPAPGQADYLTYLTDRGRSAATVIRSAASIKSFYNYLVVSDAIKANPAKGIAAAKAERKCPQILTGREVELLLEQPKCVDEKGFRTGPCWSCCTPPASGCRS